MKYVQYEKAVAAALEKTSPETVSVIMVVGAGRGKEANYLVVEAETKGEEIGQRRFPFFADRLRKLVESVSYDRHRLPPFSSCWWWW